MPEERAQLWPRLPSQRGGHPLCGLVLKRKPIGTDSSPAPSTALLPWRGQCVPRGQPLPAPPSRAGLRAQAWWALPGRCSSMPASPCQLRPSRLVQSSWAESSPAPPSSVPRGDRETQVPCLCAVLPSGPDLTHRLIQVPWVLLLPEQASLPSCIAPSAHLPSMSWIQGTDPAGQQGPSSPSPQSTPSASPRQRALPAVAKVTVP